MSERHACRLLGLARSTKRYQGKKGERDAALRMRLKELAARRMRFWISAADRAADTRRDGNKSQACVSAVSRGKLGHADPAAATDPLEWASQGAGRGRPNEKWSMDFVSDCVSTGRVIRMLTVVDNCTRECPAIEVDTSLGGLRVRRVLDRIASERGLPEAIVLDNGPEFRGRALTAWSEERGVRLEFIQPGKPVQNAYAESFNGRLRDECLNANWFTSLSDAPGKSKPGGRITTNSDRIVR